MPRTTAAPGNNLKRSGLATPGLSTTQTTLPPVTPRPEVRHIVRNQSSRSIGAKVGIIVLHSTEGSNAAGIRDLQGLGVFFDRPSAQASSHAANDAEGFDARFVPDSRKAWTCAGYNSVSLNLEMIGFAAQTHWPEAQVKNAAEWIAYWSKLHNIPIQHGRVENGRVVREGVVFHSELGAIGGGHHDPGPNFPLEHCLKLAAALDNVDPRKQAIWQAHLTTARAQLKTVLNLRATLRQRKLEKTARYGKTTDDLNALRKTIDSLKNLIRR